jgi:hypothetical protein
MPGKPNWYSIKIVMVCDAKMFYMANAKVYIGKGKQNIKSYSSLAEYYLLNLMAPIQNLNRTLTADNWFTSITAAQKLSTRKEDHSCWNGQT